MKRMVDVMTRQPWTVQVDDSLAVARRMIAEREIHHLPVLDGGVVVGMVTERDLASTRDRIGTVSEVMEPAHRVDAEDSVEGVLGAMTEGHWDAVVIASDGEVEGIFTASDCVRILHGVVAGGLV